MPVITGGRAGGGTRPDTVGVVALPEPGSNEERVADAVLACIARWGIRKTTVDDVAREAGLSRATVYRLFPGGRTELVRAAVLLDVARLSTDLAGELADAEDLEDALVRGMHATARYLAEDEALAYLRTHEPEAVEAHLAFDRLDGLFLAAGTLVGPALALHLPEPGRAPTVAVWAARLVVSYFLTPSPDVDLTREGDVRRLVRTHLLPGIVPEHRPATRPDGPRPSEPTLPDPGAART